MTQGRFARNLTVVLLLTTFLLVPLHIMGAFRPYIDISAIGVVFFTALCIIVYKMGNAAAKSTNKGMYINVILMNVMVKMFASFAIIFTYVKITNPPDKLFVVPFLITYFIFTAFETYFMSIQSKSSNS